MRLLLVLLVLLYVSFVYTSDSTCKQLCSDKKTCCSSPLDNEYYFKSIECFGEKTSSPCANKKYFSESEYFAKGSTITICRLNKGDLVVEDRLGKHSSDGRYSDVSSAVSSITNSVSSSLSSLVSSAAGSSTGDFDNSYTGDDSGATLKNKDKYKGGEGKLVNKNQLQLHNDNVEEDDELQGKKKPHTSHAAVLAIQAVANSVQSAMASTIDTTGVFGEGLYTPSEEYKGGDGKLNNNPSTNKIIIGKCVKVSNIVNNLGSNKHLDKPIINGSKQICADLFGSKSCESEEHVISAVQSTKNDGFANDGVFDVTQMEYDIIIKHGKILRNQCELKGKCQFNRA